MEFKDYYQTLGVGKGATADEVKKAYRRLARKYHPDVSKEPDAQKRMQEVNEAHAVLADPEKRAAYDSLGSRYQPGQEFRPAPDWDAGFEFSGDGLHGAQAEDFSEFFSSLFGRAGRAGGAGGAGWRRGGGAALRGEDHHAKIVIDLADTYRGAVRALALRAPRMDAQGRVIAEERTLNVKIPKGVKAGQHIRLAGQGSPGFSGGAAGDLFLEVQFRPDARYRVEDRDVFETVPVTPWEAALGASIQVPTPSGSVQVTVPPNSPNGRKLRLKARGIPADPPGDLFLELQLVLPRADSDKARELFRNMQRELAFDPRQSMGEMS
jgi:curved DNA-binding protein